MESRRSPRIGLRRVALMAALAALLAPAGAAEAAKKKKKVVYPTVSVVRPMEAAVGDMITIHGKNFRRGKGRNAVVFRRDGAKAVFVQADVATKKMIRVQLPERLEEFLAFENGARQPTRFRLRVLAARFGKSFTTEARSPVIRAGAPKAAPGTPDAPTAPTSPPPPPPADADCDGDGQTNGVDADDDNDLLVDEVEARIKTDACKADTDGDGVEDGYEYQSALDLNDDRYQNPDEVLPYPQKMPYPNPLFRDANSDYDGDGLWLVDEYRLWNVHGERSLSNLLYSDGKQKSRVVAAVGYDKQALFLSRAADRGYSAASLLNMNGFPVANLSGLNGDYNAFWNDPTADTYFSTDMVVTDVERYYYDHDLDGTLGDDERDEDGDGLSNWQEAHGFATPEWWTHLYAKEKPYVNAFKGTDLTDWDTDGDGVVDGADDQDFDDVPNVRELRRQLVAGEVPGGATDSPCGGTYTTFVMGEDPYSVCWNRPQEATDEDPWSFGPRHAWVQPFNPCLPNPRSRTCERYPNLNALYPPFDKETPIFNVFDGQFWTAE